MLRMTPSTGATPCFSVFFLNRVLLLDVYKMIKSLKHPNHLFTFCFVFFQSIEFWQEAENGELLITVKLYAKKDTHMVRTLTCVLCGQFIPIHLVCKRIIYDARV